MIIRTAQPTELGCLAGIEREAGTLFPPGRVPDPAATMPRHELEAALAADLLFVAIEQEAPAGFAVCEVVDGYLYLAELSVHPAHGRRGIGRRLVEHVVAVCRSRALAGVTLTTFADMPWNAPFYRRLGFVDDAHANELTHVREHVRAETAAGMSHRIGMLLALPAEAPQDDAPGTR